LKLLYNKHINISSLKLTNLVSFLAPTSPAVQQFVKKSMFKMMFPFEARNPDELSLEEGDLVQVIYTILFVSSLCCFFNPSQFRI